MITDLGHPAFAAHDVGRTLDFYALLDIEEAFRLYHDNGSLMLVYLHAAGDRFIELFPGGSPSDPDRQDSFMHVCLLTEDIHASIVDHNWQAWTRVPDGNEIELMQLSEESPQWWAARSAGQDGD